MTARALPTWQVRANAATIAVGTVALAASVMALAVLALKAGAPITEDGAQILADRYPLTIDSALQPFHAHLNFVPIVLWGILGVGPQLLALLLVTHVALAIATAAFLVRRLGPVPGFALSLPLAVLGSAWYDLLMPWQILFSLALLAGLGAAWLAVPRERPADRRLWTLLLSVLAVTTSNAGVFAVGAVGLWLVLERRWRQLSELVPAGALWLAWFLTRGIGGADAQGLTASLAAVPYTLTGLASGLAGWAGLPWQAGYMLLGFVAAWAVLRRPTIPSAIVAYGVTIVAMFFVLSFFRWQLVEQAATGRYVYLVAYLLAFGIGIAAPRIRARPALLAASVGATVLNVAMLVGALA